MISELPEVPLTDTALLAWRQDQNTRGRLTGLRAGLDEGELAVALPQSGCNGGLLGHVVAALQGCQQAGWQAAAVQERKRRPLLLLGRWLQQHPQQAARQADSLAQCLQSDRVLLMGCVRRGNPDDKD